MLVGSAASRELIASRFGSSPGHFAPRILTSAALSIGLTGIVAGCSLFETPFGLKVDSINESGPQQPAAITISDAPVFSREALINDRLREINFLTALLKESEGKDFRENFQPQVVRDLVNMQVLVGNLRAAFNPGLGSAAQRTEAQNELRNDIALLKLERERVIAQRNLQQAQDEAVGLDTLTPDESNLEEEALVAPELPSQEKQFERLDKAISRAESLVNGLATRAGDSRGARPTAVTGTPLEMFRDVQAYRAELRQALSEAELDDLHDHAGNALYRLHFVATVLPGQHKDKLGVARLTYLPPLLTEEDIVALYSEWLIHVSQRLNVVPAPPLRRKTINAWRGLEAVGMFEIVELDTKKVPVEPREDEEGPREDGEGVREDGEGVRDDEEGVRDDEEGVREDERKNSAKCGDSFYFAVPKRRNNLDASTVSLEEYPYFSTTAESDVEITLISSHQAVFLRFALEQFSDDRLNACDKKALISARKALRKVAAPAMSKFGISTVPDQFVDAIAYDLSEKESQLSNDLKSAVRAERLRFKNASGGTVDAAEEFSEREPNLPAPGGKGRLWIAAGDAYTYATIPLEKAQRISTIARSANSLELALSIAATVPQSGVDADGALGYSRSAAGAVEALERAPLVVGFADRRANIERTVTGQDPLYTSEIQAPQSGWIFGPAVRLNPRDNTLELIQTAKSHRLATDVSFPGWWPRVRIVKETAWIGNWHNTDRVIRLEDEKGQGYHRENYFTPLPRKRIDLDALTNFISTKTIGSTVQRIQIESVDPYYLSACTKDVEIAIIGANVWRSTEVRLAGIRSSAVSVLPDMEGVVASFDLDELFESKDATFTTLGLRRDLNLLVSTRNGNDSVVVSMEGSRDPKTNTCVAASPFAPTRKEGFPQIRDVTPRRIAAGVTAQTFAVRLAGPMSKAGPTFMLNGNRGVSDDLGGGLYVVNFSSGVLTPPGMNAISLDALAGDALAGTVITSFPIEIVAAKKASTGPSVAVLSATITGTRSNKEVKFSMDMTIAGLAINASTRAGVTPAKAPPGTKPILSTGVPAALPDQGDNKNRYRVNFVIKRSNADHAPWFDSFIDGAKLSVSIQQLQGAGANTTALATVKAKPTLKIKKSSAGTTSKGSSSTLAITIDGSKEASDLPAKVTLLFPEKAEETYPDLKTAKLSAAIKGHESDVKLVVAPETVTIDANRKMSVNIALSSESNDAYNTIRNTPETNKDLEVVFKLSASKAPTLPTDFKIKAKP